MRWIIDIHLTRTAAKGLDNLIHKGSNVKNGRAKILTALEQFSEGNAPRIKTMSSRSISGLDVKSIELHDHNAFRGLVIQDYKTDNLVLVAALTHDEYDRTLLNIEKLQSYVDAVENGHYKNISFDKNTSRFEQVYKEQSEKPLTRQDLIELTSENIDCMTSTVQPNQPVHQVTQTNIIR